MLEQIINKELDDIQTEKENIKQAIISKGGNPTDKLDSFAPAIDNIPESTLNINENVEVNLKFNKDFTYKTSNFDPDADAFNPIKINTDVRYTVENPNSEIISDDCIKCMIAKTKDNIKYSDDIVKGLRYHDFMTEADDFLANQENIMYLRNLNFASCTTANRLFKNDKQLRMINIESSTKLTNANEMFSGCRALEKINLIGYLKPVHAENIFNQCIRLKEIPFGFDTVNMTNADNLFDDLLFVEKIPKLDFTNIESANTLFGLCCNKLIDLGGFTGMKLDLDINALHNLSYQSISNVINELADVNNSESKTLTISTPTDALIDEELRQTAITKNWIIAVK